MLDMWDPNTWSTEASECRVWATPRLTHCAFVDFEDHQWALQWLWDVKIAKRSDHRKKIPYVCRCEATWVDGVRYYRSLYLHIEIMKRTGIIPETDKHILVDHIDGNTLNCRRGNLQWATYTMNRKNRTDAGAV